MNTNIFIYMILFIVWTFFGTFPRENILNIYLIFLNSHITSKIYNLHVFINRNISTHVMYVILFISWKGTKLKSYKINIIMKCKPNHLFHISCYKKSLLKVLKLCKTCLLCLWKIRIFQMWKLEKQWLHGYYIIFEGPNVNEIISYFGHL
jgi:hypothetical protein